MYFSLFNIGLKLKSFSEILKDDKITISLYIALRLGKTKKLQ